MFVKLVFGYGHQQNFFIHYCIYRIHRDHIHDYERSDSRMYPAALLHGIFESRSPGSIINREQ